MATLFIRLVRDEHERVFPIAGPVEEPVPVGPSWDLNGMLRTPPPCDELVFTDAYGERLVFTKSEVVYDRLVHTDEECEQRSLEERLEAIEARHEALGVQATGRLTLLEDAERKRQGQIVWNAPTVAVGYGSRRRFWRR